VLQASFKVGLVSKLNLFLFLVIVAHLLLHISCAAGEHLCETCRKLADSGIMAQRVPNNIEVDK
jgi:hypothetical protein